MERNPEKDEETDKVETQITEIEKKDESGSHNKHMKNLQFGLIPYINSHTNNTSVMNTQRSNIESKEMDLTNQIISGQTTITPLTHFP